MRLNRPADNAAKTWRIAELIREACEYHWVGIYSVGTDEISLLPGAASGHQRTRAFRSPKASAYRMRLVSPLTPTQRTGLLAKLLGRLNLRFPGLFVLFLALFLIDLVVPDPIPFLDELGLAVLAALFGSWKNRKPAPP